LEGCSGIIKGAPRVGTFIGGVEFPDIQRGTKCKDAFRITRSSLCCELKYRYAMLSGGTTKELSCGKKVETKTSDDKNVRNIKYGTTKRTLIRDEACFGRTHMPSAAAMRRPAGAAATLKNSAVVSASAAAETLTAAVAVVSSVTAAIGDTAAKCCDDFDDGCDSFGQDLAARLEDKKKFQLRRGWDSCAGRRTSVAIRVQDQPEGP
ncbi:hypothetical protein CLOM_g18239, partial [Closterium sp. NIES-68]